MWFRHRQLVDRDRALGYAIGKRRPRHQLHHDGVHAARLFDALDGRDDRMIQSGKRARFALESGEPLRVLGEGVGQDLDCHVALQLVVARPDGRTLDNAEVQSDPRLRQSGIGMGVSVMDASIRGEPSTGEQQHSSCEGICVLHI